MTPEQFVYWLQGFAENSSGVPTEAQWQSVKDHLETVFVKVTPKVDPIDRLRDRIRPDTIARTRLDDTLFC